MQYRLRLTMAILRRLMRWKGTYGPDLTDFSLMAGVIAVSTLAAMPGAGSSINTILSKALKVASTHGS